MQFVHCHIKSNKVEVVVLNRVCMTFCLLGSGVWGLNQKLFTYTEILVEFPPPLPTFPVLPTNVCLYVAPRNSLISSVPRKPDYNIQPLLTKRGSSSNITSKIDIVLNGFKVSTTNVTFVPEALEYVKDCFLELSDFIFAHNKERFSTADRHLVCILL